MSRSEKRIEKRWSDEITVEGPVLILEKQFTNTLELSWHVRQARIRSNGESMKTLSLFDGMSSELRGFAEIIRKRLELLTSETPRAVGNRQNAHWRLFAADSVDLREQLESLLYGYACYARQTSEAIASLKRLGDLESARLLEKMFKATDRCLWFLEIYLEAVALNTHSDRLPDWPSAV
jgi:DNA-binding ferritin-like protein